MQQIALRKPCSPVHHSESRHRPHRALCPIGLVHWSVGENIWELFENGSPDLMVNHHVPYQNCHILGEELLIWSSQPFLDTYEITLKHIGVSENGAYPKESFEWENDNNPLELTTIFWQTQKGNIPLWIAMIRIKPGPVQSPSIGTNQQSGWNMSHAAWFQWGPPARSQRPIQTNWLKWCNPL